MIKPEDYPKLLARLTNTDKVAILGLGPSKTRDVWTRLRLDGWSLWGVGQDPDAHAYDLLFQLHSWDSMPEDERRVARETQVPIMMQAPHDEAPYSVGYPLAEVAEITRDYFGSSIAFALGLAIWADIPFIHLAGVDLSMDIYDHQRPNLEYMIGLARGRAQQVTIEPGKGRLLTLYGMGRMVRYGDWKC
jgi:hypothetical protein